MYWISRAVRERGIICTLSGDGGDEVFGGYPCFWRANHLMRASALPAWLRRATRRTTGALTHWTQNWGRQVTKALTLAEAGLNDSSVLLAGLANYLSEDQKAALVRAEARGGLAPVYRLYDGYDPAAARDLEELSRRMTETWFRVSLPSDMLRKVDMMSMRASIEVRVPLLDEDVVALGLSLPHRLKTDGRSGKLVLRTLARRWLPPQVARHPKHGFTIPLDVMVGPQVHAALDDVLLSPRARTRRAVDDALVRGVRDALLWGKVLRRVIYPLDLLLFLAYRLYHESIRRRVVIMDRYFYDTLVDVADGRHWGMLRLLHWLTPTPDLAVLLDVGPEESYARKRDYPVEYLRTRWLAYRTVFPWVRGALVIKNDDLHAAQQAVARLVDERLAA